MWSKSVLVIEPTEQSGTDSPSAIVVRSGFFSLLQSRVTDDDFVETSIEVTTCHVFKLFSSLDEETSIWNFDWSFFTISEPDVKSWEFTLSVNGDEVQV